MNKLIFQINCSSKCTLLSRLSSVYVNVNSSSAGCALPKTNKPYQTRLYSNHCYKFAPGYLRACPSLGCVDNCISIHHGLQRYGAAHSFTPPSRSYAKGRNKSGKTGKGKEARVDLSMEELSEVVNGSALIEDYDDAIAQLKEDYIKSLSIRSNVGSIEELAVELEGDTYPLNELAQVHRKSSKLLVINCTAFPPAAQTVFNAITESGMNLNPQQEGTTIFVPLPKVTKEHREGMVNKAKVLYNKCKDNLRQVHNTYVRKAKNKEGQLSADLLVTVQKKIKELHDDRVKEADEILSTKQAELLKN